MNYAAGVILEVRQPAGSSEPVLRFTFKNGTDDASFLPYPMSFSDWNGPADQDVPMSTFINAFQPAAVNTTLDWCHVCGQTQARECAALLGASSSNVQLAATHDRISPVGAGFLGAGLTVAVFAMALASLAFLGFLSFGRGKRQGVQKPLKKDHVDLPSSVSFINGETTTSHYEIDGWVRRRTPSQRNRLKPLKKNDVYAE